MLQAVRGGSVELLSRLLSEIIDAKPPLPRNELLAQCIETSIPRRSLLGLAVAEGRPREVMMRINE